MNYIRIAVYEFLKGLIFYFPFIALINLLFLLSARAFCKEMTAHIAAGIHPINVICKIKHIIPVSILPLSIKERNGKKMAIKVIVLCSK